MAAHVRVRSDGRIECADTVWGAQVGCRTSSDCILTEGHAGDCCGDREVWLGEDVPYPDEAPLVLCVLTASNDMEAYAEVWCAGFENAMAQQHADDPALADDWLAEHDERVRRAYAATLGLEAPQ